MEQIRGSLLPTEKELLYLRKQFVLSAKLQGRIGNFYQVSKVVTKETDSEYEYKDPVKVAYHLVENPSRKILLKYNWFTEDEQSRPIVLYLTYYDLDNKEIQIQEGAQLEITGKRTITPNDMQTVKFQITEIQTDLELNQCVCKVVPLREEQKENVKVLADKKDPTLENVYLNRKIYYEDTTPENEILKRR